MRRLGLSSPHCLGGKIPFLGASREPSISASPRLRVPIFGTALHTLPDLPADAIIGYLVPLDITGSQRCPPKRCFAQTPI
jgi:hypothetical protein